MSVRTTAVIVSFNSADCLGPCLASIAAHTPGIRVVVVDNASSDESAAVAAAAPAVEIVQNASNLGFGRAVNQGLARASTELILILNPDCRLFPGALDILINELDTHTECAIAGPQILNADGSVQGSARGDPTWVTGLFGRSTLLTRLLPDFPAARRNVRTIALENDESFEAHWVSGACMLARRQVLADVGGFDERYFLYWEDADLCRRLRTLGRTVRYVAAAKVMHLGGRSSVSARALTTRAFHDSAYTYYATHVATSRLDAGVTRLILRVRRQWKLLFS